MSNDLTIESPEAFRKAAIEAPAGTSQIIVRRYFDADVSAVFAAFTVQELFARWTAADVDSIRVVEFDPRTGGSWRYELSVVAGQPAFGFRGVFHEVECNERIVQTFEFDRAPGVVTLSTTSFAPLAAGTLVTTVSLLPSEGRRDEVLNAGMRVGADDGYSRLEALLDDERSAAAGPRT